MGGILDLILCGSQNCPQNMFIRLCDEMLPKPDTLKSLPRLHGYGTSEGVTKGNLKRGRNPLGPEAPDEIDREYVKNVLAAQPNNAGKDPEWLAEKWIASKRFVLTTVPLDAIGVASTPPAGELAMTVGPIIVDYNKNSIGRFEGRFGAPPEAIVLDGKHRVAEALRRGEKTIAAYVGDRVLDRLQHAMAQHKAKVKAQDKALNEYRARPAGDTLRELRMVFTPDEVEKIRAQVKGLK